jgi:hypothetical protein
MILLLLAGLAAIAAGAVAAALPGVLATGLRLQAAGALGLGVAGFWALADGGTWGASFTSAFTPHVGVDGLTGLFLGTLGLIAFPSLVFASAYLQPTGHGPPPASHRSVRARPRRCSLRAGRTTFLFFWELMTLFRRRSSSSAALIRCPPLVRMSPSPSAAPACGFPASARP